MLPSPVITTGFCLQVGEALLEMDTGAEDDGAEAAASGAEPAASTSHPATAEEHAPSSSHELHVRPGVIPQALPLCQALAHL